MKTNNLLLFCALLVCTSNAFAQKGTKGISVYMGQEFYSKQMLNIAPDIDWSDQLFEYGFKFQYQGGKHFRNEFSLAIKQGDYFQGYLFNYEMQSILHTGRIQPYFLFGLGAGLGKSKAPSIIATYNWTEYAYYEYMDGIKIWETQANLKSYGDYCFRSKDHLYAQASIGFGIDFRLARHHTIQIAAKAGARIIERPTYINSYGNEWLYGDNWFYYEGTQEPNSTETISPTFSDKIIKNPRLNATGAVYVSYIFNF